MALTVAELQQGLTALTDVSVALSSSLSNFPADEAVLGDALAVVGLVGPVIVPLEMLLPVVEFMVIWLIANNKLHQQRLLNTGVKGSDPWEP